MRNDDPPGLIRDGMTNISAQECECP